MTHEYKNERMRQKLIDMIAGIGPWTFSLPSLPPNPPNQVWGRLTGITTYEDPTPKTDQEVEDEVARLVDGLDRERQIIAYKYLHGQGLRIGAELNAEQADLRRKRKTS